MGQSSAKGIIDSDHVLFKRKDMLTHAPTWTMTHEDKMPPDINQPIMACSVEFYFHEVVKFTGTESRM